MTIHERRRVRFSMEVIVDLYDLDAARVQETAQIYANADEVLADPETWDHVERLQRLKTLVLNDPEALDQFFRRRFFTFLQVPSDEVPDALAVPRDVIVHDEVALLTTLLDKLSPEDQAFFQARSGQDLMPETLLWLVDAIDFKVQDVSFDMVPEEPTA